MLASGSDNDSYRKFLSLKAGLSKNADLIKNQLSEVKTEQSEAIVQSVSNQFDFSAKLTRSQIQRLNEASIYLDSNLKELWKVGIALNEAGLPSAQFFTGLNLAYAYISSIEQLLSNDYNSRLMEFNDKRVKAVRHG